MGKEKKYDGVTDFDDIAPSAGGKFFVPGSGIAKVVVLKRKTADEANSGKDTFIAECEIETHTPGKHHDGTTAEQMMSGETRSYIVTHNRQYPKMYPSDVKKFLAGIEGGDPTKITSQIWEFSYSEEQPMSGIRFRYFATEIKTDGGGKFTRIEFKPLVEEQDASAA